MKISAKLWKKYWFWTKIKKCGNQKWWIWCFVKMIFEGSIGVSLKPSGRRSTVVDEIYSLAVLKWWCSCWIDVKCNPGVLLFCTDFCMIWMLPKNAKTIQSFALCRFQNSFSYVFGTFSQPFPLISKLCFLPRKMFFWLKSDLIFFFINSSIFKKWWKQYH